MIINLLILFCVEKICNIHKLNKLKFKMLIIIRTKLAISLPLGITRRLLLLFIYFVWFFKFKNRRFDPRFHGNIY